MQYALKQCIAKRFTLVICRDNKERMFSHMAQNEKDYKKVIGSRLHALRLSRKPGYHRRDVADELKLPHTTYNDWEGGRRGPHGGRLVELAEYYETTVDYITGKTENDKPVNKSDLFNSLNTVEQFMNNGKTLSEEEKNELAKRIQEMLNNFTVENK
jgi:transcriptional regulator with XRE-family HTH domain